jgi:glycogen operon protein
MQVWLYGKSNPADGRPYKVIDLIKQSGTVLGGSNWVADALNDPELTYNGGTHYGLRVWGPNFTYHTQWRPGTEFGFKNDVDKAGNRFNPNKVISDPYSLAISHDPEMLDSKYWSGAGYRHIDTTQVAPKSVVYDPLSYKGGPDSRKAIPWEDTIFYEVHPKGYTADSSSGVANPGTYKGFAQKLDHLKDLGVTSIEFLPVHESANDGRDSNGGNYWSYMTVNYFTPDRKYSSDKTPVGPVHEFKDMVKAIHDAGMEVILDVVYNHTGEGGTVPGKSITVAPYLNFRGIDNISYYSLKPSGSDPTAMDAYYDITGCTSTFNVANPKGAQFIIDSLRYWIDDMKIDGFRYDLASVLGNTIEHGNFKYDKTNSLLSRILVEFPNVKHVAEPWAAGGDGSYQVGNYPGTGANAWAEWQDKFRDTVRKVVRGWDNGLTPDLATRITGSADLYQDDGRKPYHSVSKVTAHDGFTMNDLVSYNLKQNLQDPPYGPSDGGTDNNYSWDTNGDETLRGQQIRNFAVYNMLSAGTPMILGGDEFRRTQRGNNNAYNMDTIVSWYDWSLKSTHAKTYQFFKGIVKLRKDNPVFKRTEFFDGKDKDNDGIPDIQWHGVSYKKPDFEPGSRTLAWRLDGSKLETKAAVDGNDFFIIANHFTDKLNFQLPPNTPGKKWYLVADTHAWWSDNQGSLNTFVTSPGSQEITDGSWTNTWAQNFEGNAKYIYGVNARSMAIFVEK